MQTLTAGRLVIAGVELRSRLFVGTGKYADDETMLAALEASGCELVTVALRRLDLDDPKKRTILDVIDWKRYRILPNTAGCRTADEAIRIARLARSMGLSDWVKLEVIPDPRYLFPDPEETLKAARSLVTEGFKVLPYINADPVLAKKLEEIGTVTVMPLGSPIGSAQGLQTLEQIRIIIEQAKIPVVVDAGIGSPSDAARAMELGADAVLVNTAIALAAGAAGVNLPENDLPVAVARALMGGRLVGRSVHSLESALRAESEGADYVIFGPVWASASHPGFAPAGLPALAEVARALDIPVLAIGGVTEARIAECAAAGAAGYAAITLFE